MNNNHKLLVGGVVIAAAILWYRHNQSKKNTMSVKPATDVSDANAANFVSGGGTMMVVGGYNSVTNQTWVFPSGNVSGGYFVSGRVLIGGVPANQGTTFTANVPQ